MNNKELAAYLMEQFAPLGGVTSRAMMGGYVFYYKLKVFGGIYEPGFMLKITQASKQSYPDAQITLPYKGGSNMILIDDIDNSELLCKTVEEMYDELPMPKAKKPRKKK